MTATSAAYRGRRNRVNGAETERAVARYLTPWWPDARRAVRSTDPDPGDIAETSPSLWWSVKRLKSVGEQVPAVWLAELTAKKRGAIGLLVVRRFGHADVGRWWCWISLADLAEVLQAHVPVPFEDDRHARFELRDVVPLLTNYTQEVAA